MFFLCYGVMCPYLAKYLTMTEAARKAYKKVLLALMALVELNADIDSPEWVLLENVAKACKDYEESKGLNA